MPDATCMWPQLCLPVCSGNWGPVMNNELYPLSEGYLKSLPVPLVYAGVRVLVNLEAFSFLLLLT